jgi:hypothetical protein
MDYRLVLEEAFLEGSGGGACVNEDVSFGDDDLSN